MTLTIDSAYSNEFLEKYTQYTYVNFPWPPMVAAHYRKRLTRALHSSESY